MPPEEIPDPAEFITSTVSNASDDLKPTVLSLIHRGAKRAATLFDANAVASLKRAKSDLSMLSTGSSDSSPHLEDSENDVSASLPKANASALLPKTDASVPLPNAAIAVPKTPVALKRSTSKAFISLDPTAPTNTTFPDKLKFAPLGDKEDMKLVTWNVSGLRAALKKGFPRYIDAENPDVICLQEIKINEPVQTLLGARYQHKYWGFEDKKGYGR